jgi:hypothetical protein
MASEVYVDLPGSGEAVWASAQRVADIGDEPIEVSVYLKPRTAVEVDPASTLAQRRAAMIAQRTTEHADDIRLMTEFAAAHGLTVTTIEPGRRLVKLSGASSQMQAAFQTRVGMYHDGTEPFRAHSGPIRIPQHLESRILAVLGLDTRRATTRRLFIADDLTSHWPNHVGQLYNFPTTGIGSGECIALLEFSTVGRTPGDAGYTTTDTNAAFQAMGLSAPTVVSVSVDGKTNAPGFTTTLTVTNAASGTQGVVRLTVNDTSQVTTGNTATVSGVQGTVEANGTWTIMVVDLTHIELQGTSFVNPYTGGGTAAVLTNADGEVALDIQVAGGVAPGANIAVYFAPNTPSGFVEAVSAAAQDTVNNPSVISISWESREELWQQQERLAMDGAMADAAAIGLSVFAGAGDNLSSDRKGTITDVHVGYPASSPWAIGCGGTRIDTTGNTISSEIVWNEGLVHNVPRGTGGGISRLYQVPTFQLGADLPTNFNTGMAGRGVPDVAGSASGASGYNIILNGRRRAFGGTSAVAPLWAGLTALLNEAAYAPIGFFLPKLYEDSWLRVITQGNNFLPVLPPNDKIGYSAGPGWSGCTGLGVPDGAALLAFFSPGRPCGFQKEDGPYALYRDGNHISVVWGRWTKDVSAACYGGAPPARSNPVFISVGGELLVLYRDDKSHISCLDGLAGAWVTFDLHAKVQAPLARGKPFPIMYLNDQLHVLYRDVNNHISDIWQDVAQQWHYQDVTALSQSPPAQGDPAASIFSNQLHVIYRDVNAHISDCRFQNGWLSPLDWTALTNAALAQGDPFPIIYLNNQLHVLYRDVQHHVSDVWCGNGFYYQDLTVLGNAPLAWGDPSAVVCLNNQLHVIYRDFDSHISDIRYSSGWLPPLDCTTLANAPLAPGDPFPMVFPKVGSRGSDQIHVLYINPNQHVSDISFVGGTWRYKDLQA